MQRRLWPWVHVHWWSCPNNWLAYLHPSVEPQSFDWCVTCCSGTLVASSGLDLPTTSVLHPREWSGARARIWSPVCDHSLERICREVPCCLRAVFTSPQLHHVLRQPARDPYPTATHSAPRTREVRYRWRTNASEIFVQVLRRANQLVKFWLTKTLHVSY